MKSEYLKVHEEHLKSKDDHKKALKEYWISKYVKTCNKINNKIIQSENPDHQNEIFIL